MIMPIGRRQESKKDTVYSKEYYNKPIFSSNEKREEFAKYGLILIGIFVLIICIGTVLEKYNSNKKKIIK